MIMDKKTKEKMSELDINRLKDIGNDYFKNQKYGEAIEKYNEAISLSWGNKALLATLLCNRAIAYIKIGNLQDAKNDCTAVLEMDSANKKAYFRRAQANELSGELKLAFDDLSKLVRIEPKNPEFLDLMRKVKVGLDKERIHDTEVNRILTILKSNEKIDECMKGLISLCIDDKSHVVDLVRKGGVEQIASIINQNAESDIEQKLNHAYLGLRVFSACATHTEFINLAFEITHNVDVDTFSQSTKTNVEYNPSVALVNGHNKITWDGLCNLINSNHGNISQASSAMMIRVLSHMHSVNENAVLITEHQNIKKEQQTKLESKISEEENNRPRVEELDDDDAEDIHVPHGDSDSSNGSHAPVKDNTGAGASANASDRDHPSITNEDIKAKVENKSQGAGTGTETKDKNNASSSGRNASILNESHLFLRKYPIKLLISSWLHVLNSVHENDVFALTIDAITALFSEVEDYIGHDKLFDARMENITERKARLYKQRGLKLRSKQHASWAIELDILDQLLTLMNGDDSYKALLSSNCFGRVVNAIDDDALLKEKLIRYLVGHDKPPIQAGDMPPPLHLCKLRVCLEVALFIARPDLGAWALGEKGGVQQLLFLISTNEASLQENVAELLCLASSNETASSLLSPIVSSGSITILMQSSNSHTRAAAAAALTKLSIKSKALKEDSPETTRTLNVVLDILKSTVATQSDNMKISKQHDKPVGDGVASHLVSFSTLENGIMSNKPTNNQVTTSKTDSKGTIAMTSVERAVEVLAAMVGKTHVKEELTHGSYRYGTANMLVCMLVCMVEYYYKDVI